jgi:hypothetical protein
MKTKILAIKNNSATFYILFTAIVFCAFLYIYSVNAAVRNVVAREGAESELSQLRNMVSELEYRYMNTENRLTLEQAEHLGLSEPVIKTFISRNNTGKALSINTP